MTFSLFVNALSHQTAYTVMVAFKWKTNIDSIFSITYKFPFKINRIIYIYDGETNNAHQPSNQPTEPKREKKIEFVVENKAKCLFNLLCGIWWYGKLSIK
jgi:hypothetical protein